MSEGMVIPPADIQSVVDITANFVAKKGKEFENVIRQKNDGNPKFSFLNSADPYHPYYKSKCDEALASEAGISLPGASGGEVAQPEKTEEETPAAAAPEPIVREPPPPFHHYLPNGFAMTTNEIELVRISAMFCAAQGEEFQSQLAAREFNNPQYTFLKPTEPAHAFFLKYVESYKMIIFPQEKMMEQLRIDVDDKAGVLKRIEHRAEFEDDEKTRKEKMEKENEERMASLRIDWHDFVIVETIVFTKEEESVGQAPREADTNEMEMDMEDSDDDEPKVSADVNMAAAEAAVPIGHGGATGLAATAAQRGAMELAADENLQVVSGYQRTSTIKKTGARSGKTQICPRCKVPVAIEDMEEHMRIELLDPRWAEQRQKMLAREREGLIEDPEAIAQNLGKIAENRDDVFGGQAPPSAQEMQNAHVDKRQRQY